MLSPMLFSIMTICLWGRQQWFGSCKACHGHHCPRLRQRHVTQAHLNIDAGIVVCLESTWMKEVSCKCYLVPLSVLHWQAFRASVPATGPIFHFCRQELLHGRTGTPRAQLSETQKAGSRRNWDWSCYICWTQPSANRSLTAKWLLPF